MSEQIQIVPNLIHIKSIKILGGSITSELENTSTSQIVGFNVQYGIKDSLNYREKTFRFIFSVNIEALGSDERSLGTKAQYAIEYIFFIENLDYYVTSVDHKGKQVVFHPVLPNTLLSIVYSTSRGIILTRSQGTIIEGVILPVVNTADLLNSLEPNTPEQFETTN